MAYKNVVGAHPSSWRGTSSIEPKTSADGNQLFCAGYLIFLIIFTYFFKI